MKLIGSAQALDFLGQAAPRPWLKRMLMWMMLDERLSAFFTRGRIQPHTTVASFIYTLDDYNPDKPLSDLINENYEAEFASKLIGKGLHDRVDDDPTVWDENEEPHSISVGFFMYADFVDWDAGHLSGSVYPELKGLEEAFFWDHEEHLGSEFERPEFDYELFGLCFDAAAIELLLPTHRLSFAGAGTDLNRRSPIGRPLKWDWEGAMAALVAVAQHPDGLPTGAGAQAQIEKRVADWFMRETGDCPSPSQIRQHVAALLRRFNTAENA